MISQSNRKSVSFKAQARTIDHLGKGQIADAPTAVSELWKNSYDAYARDVALHLYDADIKCGAIIDNGCGMTYEQLSDSWLTIGTASKTTKKLLPENDRFGLPDRSTQGEKGIGRLSTAFLAPVTLIVTKKIDSRFSAALIDWRLFENTYLSLHDIKVPMSEFDSLEQLPALCTELQRDMLSNLALEPSESNPEDLILRRAWERFTDDEKEAYAVHQSNSNKTIFTSTEDKIKYLSETHIFDEHYLEQWFKILDKAENLDGDKHGTALFLLDLNRDLELLTDRGQLGRDSNEFTAIEKDLVDTLRAFVDPFKRKKHDNKVEFHYEIQSFERRFWIDDKRKEILNYKDVFDADDFSILEHKIEGIIDEKGWFRGDITAFGEVYKNIAIMCRTPGMGAYTETGTFKIKIGTFEQESAKSTHDLDSHDHLIALTKKYSGFMIFRDNLRVLPYGKSNNDFFQIEERRGKNAGRYYWASRRLFGHISLKQQDNYKLKDKAGREGFIINQAARELKSLVIQLLTELADRFFGTKSDNRQIMLEALSKARQKQKKAQKASARINVKTFTSSLKQNEGILSTQVEETKNLHAELSNDITISLNQLDVLVEKIDRIESLRTDLKVPNKPAKITEPLEEQYRSYRDMFAELTELLRTCREKLNKIEAQGQYFSPIQSAEKKYKNSDSSLNKQLTRYTTNIENTFVRLKNVWLNESREDKKAYEKEALPILDAVTESSDVASTLNSLDAIYITLADEFSYKYDAFLQALDKLESGIDLDSAFVIAEEERVNAEKEINQIRSLAQLGISFEVLAHELNAQDQAVTRALKSMSSDAQSQIGFKNAMAAHKQFTDYLRFLSPLKLSGYQARDDITGVEIIKNIYTFFRDRFERQNVELVISPSFENMVVVDVKSRIIPVFINILNNALYWVGLAENRTIKVDIVGDLVVIANSGPAVDEEDIDRLFELFYSRRSNGNGVGLYLSKQNLSVAHHKIWYAEKEEEKLIKDGANFVIQFRGMEIKK
ncbi:sensor histidine kinase [Pseudoalteromonas rhizosphaerae]|uniref:sensor histidine kinase n=1 Tax=Pseudoalteromonas rhizosphaerae TaxID=2518973 RepID=UPI001230C7D6|nr:sensor histidine kinase [Pseudoalteromonas rhizosphaerae]